MCDLVTRPIDLPGVATTQGAVKYARRFVLLYCPSKLSACVRETHQQHSSLLMLQFIFGTGCATLERDEKRKFRGGIRMGNGKRTDISFLFFCFVQFFIHRIQGQSSELVKYRERSETLQLNHTNHRLCLWCDWLLAV